MAAVHGVLLAAGAGRRYGGAKALAHDPDGTSWLRRTLEVLHEGGCAAVTVVLGSDAEAARALLADAEVAVVVAPDWAAGMSASLRSGLSALPPAATAALVHLVDLPDVGAPVVRRLLAREVTPATLRRATYAGTPGHPVLLGRDHWAGVLAGADGDRGARDYLRTHAHEDVECGDLGSGRDVDHQRNIGPFRSPP